MNTDAYTETFNAGGSDIDDTDDDIYPLRCWDCNVNFTSREYLHKHLFHHIKQPYVLVEKLQLPPLKITLKQSSDNSFEIVSNSSSPSHSVSPPTAYGSLSDCQTYNSVNLAEGGASAVPHIIGVKEEQKEIEEEEDGQDTTVRFSPNFVVEGASPSALSSPASTPGASTPSEHERDTGEGSSSTNTATLAVSGNGPEYGCIPGAEPTPPPEPSPDYPKIRIKTTGLLKEPLTITEITDENPTGDPNLGQSDSSMWATPSLDDPLKLPDSDDNNILALFNNNDKAKDYGFCSTDSEYISLDRLEERNRGTMQLYNSNNAVVPSSNQSPLDQLTGLPMQALAQQVSRLQPSGNSSGMHQQNVLINIQQFPSAPPQPSYQPPPMYPHHQAPMYPPYQYQPPNPMYYPPAPGYPPQPHMPPPPPQMNQMHPMPGTQQPPPMGQPPSTMGQPPALGQPPMSQAQPMNPMTQTQQSQQPQQQSYRQPMPPRQAAPRQPAPGQRMAMAPRGVGNRAPAPRQRMPMMRPRGAAPVQTRGPRPRMGTPQNGQVRPQSSPVKRDGQQMVGNQALKKKKLDLLTPDKDDDDCQVICTQPKNMDGGLPQIESVQGGTSEPAESSIMHLSDSITLSVRNPPPKPAEQAKKSDASAVANILATRGITVTATAKQKEKELSSKSAPALPSSLNLNGAVSILPAANKPNGTSKSQDNLPTVDLTDDAPPPKQANSPQKRPGLPYRCDLCPAQYPNAIGLNKHRQTYHKTTGGMCELGIPLVNLKQPGIMQKLASIGINNYIPLPSANGDGTFGLPIISTRNPGNVSALGATQMLNLGPVRAIPKPQNNNNKPPVNQKT